MAGLVPAMHALDRVIFRWMPATRAGMPCEDLWPLARPNKKASAYAEAQQREKAKIADQYRTATGPPPKLNSQLKRASIVSARGWMVQVLTAMGAPVATIIGTTVWLWNS